jgi:primase-polymerase (primpol)-like protein
MYLYPYKIFTISKNKRLLHPDNTSRTIGIYDAKRMNFYDAAYEADKIDAKVSILLGEVANGIKLMCLDLDDCFNKETSELDKDTTEFLKEFDKSEWEVSSSGTGIHIYILTKLDLNTFIVKDIEGCKSFECYTNKRHIVTTTFDFEGTNLTVGKHDTFITDMYDIVEALRKEREPNRLVEDVKLVFKGKEIKSEKEALFGRTPVTDMHTLRGCGYKDANLISIIDECPDAVDQSAHDAKLIRKLMYYTLSFNDAWEMAKKTNYYKAKDEKHKKKFDNETYKERTRRLIMNGRTII